MKSKKNQIKSTFLSEIKQQLYRCKKEHSTPKKEHSTPKKEHSTPKKEHFTPKQICRNPHKH